MQVLCACQPTLSPRPGSDVGAHRVRIAHNHALIAAGIAAVLTPQLHPAEACNGHTDVIADVVIMDAGHAMRMLGSGDSIVDKKTLLIVENALTTSMVRRLLHLGVQACVNAAADPTELVSAVRTLGRGGKFFCTMTTAMLADASMGPVLTARERSVLELLCTGLDNKSIAAQLKIAPGTVKSHVKAVLSKTGTRTRTAAAAHALRHGWTAFECSPA